MMDKQTFYKKECVSGRGGWTQKELKDICVFFKLKTSGTKEILCDRIKTFLGQEYKNKNTGFEKETIDFILYWILSTNHLKDSYHFYKLFYAERDLQKTVEDKEYVLYRGLSWNLDNKQWLTHFANSFGTHKMYSIGDYFDLKIASLSSWTTDKRIASSFTMSSKKKFSIRLKLTTNSKNVLADIEKFYKMIGNSLKRTDKLDEEALYGIKHLMSQEKEIILKPGTYKVQVDLLKNNSLKDPYIKSMDEWGKEVSTNDEFN